jgi:hypothetical protein
MSGNGDVTSTMRKLETEFPELLEVPLPTPRSLDEEVQLEIAAAERRREALRLQIAAEIEQNANPRYQCEKCQDEGVVDGSYFKPETLVWCDRCWRGPQYREQFEESQARQEAEARARRKAALERLFGEPGVPKKYRGLTLETLKTRCPGAAIEGKVLAGAAARALIDEGQIIPANLPGHLGLECVEPDRPRRGLLMWGPVGVGKTGIAASVFNALLEKLPPDATALFVDVSDLLRRKQDSYSGSDEDRRRMAAAMAAIRKADLLVLDDLGDAARNGSTTTDKREIVYDIIHSRYNDDQGITIVTTNLSPAEQEQQWGDRLADRLWDMMLIVQVGGVNMRRRQ